MERMEQAQALRHLRNVLYILRDLHPNDSCDALEEARSFYNERCPLDRVKPSGMSLQRFIADTIS